MKVIVKKLQGGECSVDVLPSTSIAELKRKVANQLNIPIEQQKLLLLGRTLADEQTVESYPAIRDGTKLNLVVKKPETLYHASVKYFKQLGMTDPEAINAANRLLRVVQEKFDRMSWDDIDRLCEDCLLDEAGQSRPTAEHEADCDEPMYTL